MIIAYIPCKDEDEASTIAKALVGEKLAACAHLWPIRSIYMWEGSMEDGTETVLLAKTDDSLYGALAERVTELHSYDVPAIIKVQAIANKEYEKWLKEELTKK